jgi:oxaloacetate decarboxylase (Na+ extruding) subunit gamma
MTDPLLQQGLDLMIYGMSAVILFLTLLASVTVIVSAVIRRFFPEMPESAPISPNSVSAINSLPAKGAIDKKLLTILQNAIDQHRSRK